MPTDPVCFRGYNYFPNEAIEVSDGDIVVTIPAGRIYAPQESSANCAMQDWADATLAVEVCLSLLPTAESQSLDTPNNTPIDIVLGGTGEAPLIFTILTQPLHGTLSGDAPNLTYTPDPTWTGEDSFTFDVSSGPYASAPATITIDTAALDEFLADFITIEYTFLDGLDLDTSTRLSSPEVGIPVGWCQADQFFGSDFSLWYEWAGDNVGTGFESILVHVDNIRNLYPAGVIEGLSAGNWYNVRESGDVTLKLTAYQGGTMEFIPNEYRWINVGGVETASRTISNNVELNLAECLTDWECISGWTYDLSSNTFLWQSCP